MMQQQLLQTFLLLDGVLPIGEIYILAFDNESSVWMNRIFGTIATQSSFWPFIARPTRPPLEGRKGMQDGSHASQAWLKAAPGSRPITRKWNGQNGTRAGHTIKKSACHEHVFTETFLLHNIPDEAVGLSRPCPGLEQDGGGGVST